MRHLQRELPVPWLKPYAGQAFALLNHQLARACPHVVRQFGHHDLVERSMAKRVFCHLHVFLGNVT